MRAAVLALVLALSAPLALACGGSDEPDEEAAVRATLGQYTRAVAAKDYDTLCDRVFDPDLLRGARAQGLPCEAALKTGFGEVERPTLRVRSVRVQPDRGTADAVVATDAANQPPSTDTVRLVRRPAGWRIIALSSG